MTDIYIIGLGMIRFNKYPDRGVRDMAHEVTRLALKDAGMNTADLEAAFFSNTFWGMFSNQHSIKGQVVLRSMGIDTIPVTNVENACAGASTALHLAYTGIKAGMYDVALALGSEKITGPDKTKSLGAYAACMDVENFESHIKMQVQHSRTFSQGLPVEDSTPGAGRSVFMDAYATFARWHMQKYGSTQHQLGLIASKNHWHESLNPMAQYQQRMTIQEVLADHPVTYPLTRSMCAPVGDGAAAAIICSEKYLKRLTLNDGLPLDRI